MRHTSEKVLVIFISPDIRRNEIGILSNDIFRIVMSGTHQKHVVECVTSVPLPHHKPDEIPYGRHILVAAREKPVDIIDIDNRRFYETDACLVACKAVGRRQKIGVSDDEKPGAVIRRSQIANDIGPAGCRFKLFGNVGQRF